LEKKENPLRDERFREIVNQLSVNKYEDTHPVVRSSVCITVLNRSIYTRYTDDRMGVNTDSKFQLNDTGDVTIFGVRNEEALLFAQMEMLILARLVDVHKSPGKIVSSMKPP
jgi:hypothetical protein